MTPTEKAARWLEDVPRYNGHFRANEGDMIRHDDALAAIARHLAPGDDLVERLLDWPYQGETMAHEAAARISALTAQRDDFKSEWDKALELADRAASLMSEMDDRRISAETENATLRDRLARIEKAADRIANWTIGGKIADDPENLAKYPLLAGAILDLRAALTDGGSNG